MNQMIEQIKKLEDLIKIYPKNFINYFNLGNIYAKLNKYDLALINFQKTVDLNQNFFQGYNNLANTHKELNNIEKSIKFFKKAIELNPNYINALYNLAIAYSDIGKYEESATYFKKVLKINPKHLAALNNFGLLLKSVNKYDAALRCFEKIIYIDNNFLKAYNNIGTISLELGDIESAIYNYKKAFKLNPDNFISYKNLLVTYENSNQIENYNKILKLSKKRFPDEKILKLYTGILLFRKNKFKKSINLLNKINFDEESRTEIKRNFFLAKSFDHLNKIDQAFKYFTKANELENNSIRTKKFDKNRYLNTIEKKKNYFTKKNINKWTTIKYSSSNFSPVFLIGFPRSGTTLLDTILRSHPKIKVVEEKPMVLKMVDQIKNKDLCSLNDISILEIKHLQKEYLIEMNKYISTENKSNLYIDKLPLNIINTGEIVRIFPNAKFILALRHPIDCILSCFMQNFEPNDAMNNFLNLKDATILYKKTMELWNQYISVLKVNYISIKYEDLIQNFETNIKIIIKFLNLNWNKSLLNYRETAIKRGKISTPSYYQVIQPIYKHADQRWKRYKKHLTNIESNLSELIKQYNYFNK